jgi:hypothetical protein
VRVSIYRSIEMVFPASTREGEGVRSKFSGLSVFRSEKPFTSSHNVLRYMKTAAPVYVPVTLKEGTPVGATTTKRDRLKALESRIANLAGTTGKTTGRSACQERIDREQREQKTRRQRQRRRLASGLYIEKTVGSDEPLLVIVKSLRTCEHCGQDFTPLRTTARFCSSKCRVYWNRAQG